MDIGQFLEVVNQKRIFRNKTELTLRDSSHRRALARMIVRMYNIIKEDFQIEKNPKTKKDLYYKMEHLKQAANTLTMYDPQIIFPKHIWS